MAGITYKRKIEKISEQIEELYDEAGHVRDFAITEEKKYLDRVREGLNTARNGMRSLNNTLDFFRGEKKYDGPTS